MLDRTSEDEDVVDPWIECSRRLKKKLRVGVMETCERESLAVRLSAMAIDSSDRVRSKSSRGAVAIRTKIEVWLFANVSDRRGRLSSRSKRISSRSKG